MRVLIVGCGYIGLPTGAALVQRGHDVTGWRRNGFALEELRASGIRPYAVDVTKPETFPSLDEAYDWVVNSVAAGGGGVEEYRAVYLEGTKHLLQWLSKAPPKRYVYTSSTSVYGQNDGSVVDEHSATCPGTETSRVLVETERLLLAAVQNTGFPAVILRLSGIYGPGRGYWFRQFLQGEARIEGTGERILNMVHRDDVVGAILAALDRGKPGEVYNVTDDWPVSQLEFFRVLASLSNKPLPQRVEPGADLRKRGTTNKRISNRKLRCELGYELVYPDFRAGWRGLGGGRD